MSTFELNDWIFSAVCECMFVKKFEIYIRNSGFKTIEMAGLLFLLNFIGSAAVEND